jgi:putative flippase GtrA
MSEPNGSRFFKNQVVRFIFSAGMGFLVDVCVFYLLYRVLLKQPNYQILQYEVNRHSLSLGISFFVGVMVNFLITRYLVFQESTSSPAKQLIRFLAVAVLGFIANLIILNFLVRVGVDAPLARVISALSLFFASFFVHKFFSFSISHKRRHATTATSDNRTGN